MRNYVKKFTPYSHKDMELVAVLRLASCYHRETYLLSLLPVEILERRLGQEAGTRVTNEIGASE